MGEGRGEGGFSCSRHWKATTVTKQLDIGSWSRRHRSQCVPVIIKRLFGERFQVRRLGLHAAEGIQVNGRISAFGNQERSKKLRSSV
jgi:hypothetical protein